MAFDTFEDMTPVTEEASTPQGNSSDLDTFDNLEPVLEEQEQTEEASKTGQTEDKAKGEEESQVSDKQHSLLEDSKEENKDSKEASGKDKGPESKEGSGKGDRPNGEETGKSEEGQAKPEDSKRALRVKDGDKAVDISPDATLKIPVNGKKEIVTIADLKANYSGKVAWGEKIHEARTKINEVTAEKQQFEAERNKVFGDIEKVVEILDAPDRNPLDAMKELLDRTGRPSHIYMRKLYEAGSQEYGKLSEMDENQRELYWKDQELEYNRNIQSANEATLAEKKAEKELLQKVDALREKFGISEEDYTATAQELLNSPYKDQLTPEKVALYAAKKPYFEKAENILKQFEEDLDDNEMQSFVTGVANLTFDYPQINQEEAIRTVASRLGFELIDDAVEEIAQKIPERVAGAPKPNTNYKYGGRNQDAPRPEDLDTFENAGIGF